MPHTYIPFQELTIVFFTKIWHFRYPLLVLAIAVVETLIFFAPKFHHDRIHILVSLSIYAAYLSFWVVASIDLARSNRFFGFLVTSSLALILLVDLGFYFGTGCPPIRKQLVVTELEPDHIGYRLGPLPLPDTTISDSKFANGEQLFKVDMAIDEYHKRVTPTYTTNPQKHALFFGCSVCFGYGNKDDETLPSQFASSTCDYQAYNFGYNGWGMHNMLARLEYEDIPEQVIQKDGIAIYVMLWSHFRRMIGDYHSYTQWAHKMPYYKMQDGSVKRSGIFADGRPFTSRFYEWLWHWPLIRQTNLNLPLSLSNEDLQLGVDIVAESKRQYEKQFGSGSFYVVIFPTAWENFPQDRLDTVLAMLESSGIEVINLVNQLNLSDDKVIPTDGHPNAIAFKEASELIITELGIQAKPCSTDKHDHD